MSFTLHTPAERDPIFQVAEEAKSAGPGALDASIGVILDEEGRLLTLECVRKAAGEYAHAAEKSGFPYPPLLGVPAFRTGVTKLLYGAGDSTIASIAATGGTGALALAIKLLQKMEIRRVLLPLPSWPNHRRLLDGFGMETLSLHAREKNRIQIGDIVDGWTESHGKKCALLLQAGCHNPTGRSWTAREWEELAAALAGSPHVVLLDCAYQGLGEGVEEDAAPTRILRQAGVPHIVAWSASKNHTAYGLRTGLVCAVASSEREREELEQHLMILARELHSAAPTPGQHIVAAVQARYGEAWRRELASLRTALGKKRALLQQAFPPWSAQLEGRGLFTILPLAPEAIRALRKERVFLTDDGRMNIAGIPLGRMEEFCAKVRTVL